MKVSDTVESSNPLVKVSRLVLGSDHENDETVIAKSVNCVQHGYFKYIR